MKDNEIWDNIKGEFIETPKEMIEFLNDIDTVCKSHYLSISTGHSGFEIELYKESNIERLKNASKSY